MNIRHISTIILGTLALLGCSPATSGSDKPSVSQAYETHNNHYGLNRSLNYNNNGNTVDFYPITLDLLPKQAKKLRYEGNGWYTFLWKGGCYMAVGQDSGKWNFMVTINQAHNKQVCDLSVDPVEQVYEYDQSEQISTEY